MSSTVKQLPGAPPPTAPYTLSRSGVTVASCVTRTSATRSRAPRWHSRSAPPPSDRCRAGCRGRTSPARARRRSHAPKPTPCISPLPSRPAARSRRSCSWSGRPRRRRCTRWCPNGRRGAAARRLVARPGRSAVAAVRVLEVTIGDEVRQGDRAVAGVRGAAVLARVGGSCSVGGGTDSSAASADPSSPPERPLSDVSEHPAPAATSEIAMP